MYIYNNQSIGRHSKKKLYFDLDLPKQMSYTHAHVLFDLYKLYFTLDHGDSVFDLLLYIIEASLSRASQI